MIIISIYFTIQTITIQNTTRLCLGVWTSLLQHQLWSLSLINFVEAKAWTTICYFEVTSAIIRFRPLIPTLKPMWILPRNRCRTYSSSSLYRQSIVIIDHWYTTSVIALDYNWIILRLKLIHFCKVWGVDFQEWGSALLLLVGGHHTTPLRVHVWKLFHDFVLQFLAISSRLTSQIWIFHDFEWKRYRRILILFSHVWHF